MNRHLIIGLAIGVLIGYLVGQMGQYNRGKKAICDNLPSGVQVGGC